MKIEDTWLYLYCTCKLNFVARAQNDM